MVLSLKLQLKFERPLFKNIDIQVMVFRAAVAQW